LSNRTAWPGQATTGATHTAAHDNDLPGGWIGYVQVVASQTGITTETDLTGLSQAVTVNTSRRILITFDGAYACSSGAGNRATFRIKEGSTVLQQRSFSPDTNGTVACSFSVVLTPTAASHTYKVSLAATDAGNVQLTATSTEVAYLLIEDVGPA
jgi:hypothetical protein